MRLIDADIIKHTYLEDMFDTTDDFQRVNDVIDYAPTVDAVPVVYCKDCKYADIERRTATEKRYADSILFCKNADLCNDDPLAMWPNDFCSYGAARKVVDDES